MFWGDAIAQTSHATPAAVNTLFDDLHIDDAAENSALMPGEQAAQKINKNIFITATTSTSHCFLGEPVLLTYTLYSALQSTSYINKAPSFAGFAMNDRTPDNEPIKRLRRNGKIYRVFIIQQVQLAPLQEGLLTIDPISVYNQVTYKDQAKEIQYSGSISGNAISLSVYSLPVVGRPADFSGATGDFTLQASADSSMAAGENNTLHITVSGTGNFTAVSMPVVTWPAGCDHFTPRTRLQEQLQAFPPSATKSFDIPFVPAKEGTLVIPAMRLSFFDTRKKKYRYAATGPLSIQVTKSLRNAVSVKNSVPVTEKHFALYYVLLVIMLILCWAGIVFSWKRKHARLNLQAIAARAAAEPAGSGLAEALATLHAINNVGEYITALKQLLFDRLAQYSGKPADTEKALLQAIQQQHPALGAAASELYTQCNGLLYAVGSIDSHARQELEGR